MTDVTSWSPGVSPSVLVREFHQYVGAAVRTSPTIAVDGAIRRLEFVEEEAQELREAVEGGDLIGTADALADLTYVVFGAALHFGIDLDAVLHELHVGSFGPRGRRLRRADGATSARRRYGPRGLARSA